MCDFDQSAKSEEDSMDKMKLPRDSYKSIFSLQLNKGQTFVECALILAFISVIVTALIIFLHQ
jgi:hypothetical protein